MVVVVQVSFDLLEAYLREHPEASDCGVGFRENALFQDYHGLKSFRMVRLLDEQPTLVAVCLISCWPVDELINSPCDVWYQLIIGVGNGELHGDDKGRQGKV